MSNELGSTHPPPRDDRSLGRIKMLLRQKLNLPFSLAAVLSGADEAVEIDRARIGEVESEVKESFELHDHFSIPPEAPGGRPWKVGTLARYIENQLCVTERPKP